MRGAARILSAKDAVAMIPSGSTVVAGGFVGAGHPEYLSKALEERFLETGEPRDLTLFYAAGQGDRGARGLNHFAHQGLIRRVIGGHWNLAPKLGRMALAGEIEAYNLPQGVICVLLREMAAKRPGVFTKAGLNTFIDPEQSAGALNAGSREKLVERIELGGETYLWYKTFPIHVGLIRGTRADRRGNISMEEEGIIGDGLPIAQAAKNHGGIVIAQVREVVDRIEDPKSVRVPGLLVDALVISPEEHHGQTFAEAFNPAFVTSGEVHPDQAPMPPSERRIIGRRALLEVPTGAVVNLGIGLPEALAAAAAEEGKLDDFTMTVESGPIGGIPAGGLNFGCSIYPEAIIDQPSQFDFYDGGGLDLTALGAAEVDEEGNVCVSQMGGRFAGVGGFVNISRSARRVVFCLSFTAGGLDVALEGGRLKIRQEGSHRKFLRRVAQVCFHGPTALASGQEVLYVTERAVFRLEADGLRLIELAPGVDLERDILPFMEFRPKIGEIRPMPAFSFL